MYRKAVTLVEVLIVVAIAAILAGLLFIAAAPGRERARQTACTSQLRQLYTAYALYADDHPGSQFPGMEQVVFIPSNVTGVLEPYGAKKQIFYCPDSTQRMRQSFGSTYVIKIAMNPWLDKDDPMVKKYLEELRILGPLASITSCDVHDMVFYSPSEWSLDPAFVKPFLIDLRQDGSVRAGRTAGPRAAFPGI